jgi:hypothetical protein
MKPVHPAPAARPFETPRLRILARWPEVFRVSPLRY